MLHDHGLTLFEPADLRDEVASSGASEMRAVVTWAVEFLSAGNERLGRPGPVCPFTKSSMDSNSFLLACAGDEHDIGSLEATIEQYRRWFLALLEQPDRLQKHLLTILVVLPGFDRTDSGPLDALQVRLKDSFVREGLMVSQFHPQCQQGGLWNQDFRPFRAPVPLLGMRQMVASDLPFLVGTASHLSAYAERFPGGQARTAERHGVDEHRSSSTSEFELETT